MAGYYEENGKRYAVVEVGDRDQLLVDLRELADKIEDGIATKAAMEKAVLVIAWLLDYLNYLGDSDIDEEVGRLLLYKPKDKR